MPCIHMSARCMSARCIRGDRGRGFGRDYSNRINRHVVCVRELYDGLSKKEW